MGEVEAQPVRVDQGAGLTNARAEVLAQSRVEEMGGGVVALGRLSALAVHPQFNRHVFLEFAIGDLDSMHDAAAIAEGIENLRSSPVPGNQTHIADLPSRFGVEGSAIEHDKSRAAHLPGGFAVSRCEANRLRLGFEVFIAYELASSSHRGTSGDTRRCRDPSASRHSPRPLPLLLQRRLEPGLVDPELLLFGNLPHRLDRQAERVVQPERRLTVEQRAARGARRLDRLLDLAGADRDRLQEAGLLCGHRRRGRLAGLLQFRIVTGEGLLERRQ